MTCLDASPQRRQPAQLGQSSALRAAIGLLPTHPRRQWRSVSPHHPSQAAITPRNGVPHSLASRLPSMLRAAASSLLGSFGWAAGTRQLAPAAAWAALSGRPLTAQAAPAEPPVQPSSEEALAEFREGVRTFAQDFVAPHAAEIDRLNAYPDGFEFWRTAGEWGLHGAVDADGPGMPGQQGHCFASKPRGSPS